MPEIFLKIILEPLPRSEPSKRSTRTYVHLGASQASNRPGFWFLHGLGASQASDPPGLTIFDGELLSEALAFTLDPPTPTGGQVRAQGLDTLQRKTTTLTASEDLCQGVRS